MGLGKTYSTKYLVDSNGNTGAANQVLVSTATGVDWVDGSGSGIIGGPYLPLSGGTITGNLTVNGTTTLGNQLTFPYGSVSDYIYHTGNGNTYYGFPSNDSFKVATAGSDRLYINSTGNVGIGTTTPAYKLDVNGNVSATVYNAGAVVLMTRASKADLYGYSGPTLSYYNGTAIVPALTVDYGNVGIGTTSPLSRLHVSDSSGGVLYLQDSDATSTYNITSLSNNGGNLSFDTRNSSGVYVSTDYQIVKDAGGANYQRWFTSATERMRITAAGNVGIGTTSPAATLDVASITSDYVAKFSHSTALGYAPGSILLESGQSTSRGQGIYHYNTLADENWFTGVPYAVSGKKWIVANQGANLSQNLAVAQLQYALLTIDSDTGNVGIGTTSPFNKLDVSGGSGRFITTDDHQRLFITSSPSHQSILYFGDTSSSTQGRVAYEHSSDSMYFNTDSSEKMRILANGNVGIGTTSPSQKLEVSGNIKLTSAADVIYFGAVGTSATWSAPQVARIGTMMTMSDYSGVQFGGYDGTSYGPRMTVLGTGNVGIGRSSSITARLFVEGPVDTSTISTSSTPAARINNGGAISNWIGSNGYNYGYIQSIQDDGSNNLKPLSLNPLGGNVGIGTTSPGSILHINSADPILLIKDSETSQTLANARLRLAESGVAGALGGYWDVGAIANGSTFDFHINDDAGERLTILKASGHVGIGTTSPTAKLQVNTSSTTKFLGTNADYVPNSTGSGVLITTGASTGNTYSQIYAFQSGNTAYANLVVPGGNVGIGTTSPGAKLEVGLTSSVPLTSQPAIPLLVSNNGYGVDGRVFIQVKHDIVNTAGAVGAGLQMTAAAVTSGTASYNNSLIFLQSAGSGTSTIHSAPQGVKFYVDNDGTAAGSGANYNTFGDLAFELQADGEAIFYDNVGIGTTSPGHKLDVESSTTPLHLNRTGGATALIGLDIAGVNRGLIGATTTAAFVSYSSGAAPLMTVLNTGNVGIGTTSPTSLLSVGNAATYNYPPTTVNIATTDTGAYLLKVTSDQFNVAGNWVGIGLGYSNQYMKMGIIAEAKDSSRRGKLHFAVKTTAGSSNAGISDAKMTIDDTGRVGIGTPSPAAKLEVRTDSGGSASNSYFRVTAAVDGAYGGTSHFEGAYNDYVNVNQPNIVGKIEMSSQVVTATDVGGTMKFFTKATGGTYATAPLERMRIDSSGNVGIGTPSPGEKLTVAGDVYAISYWSQSDKNAYYMSYDSTRGMYLSSTGFVTLNAGGNEVIRMTSSADVGIGVTSPNSKLHVDGGVQLANDTDAATAAKSGTIRYRPAIAGQTIGTSVSVVEMCMQTGASSYAWKVIYTTPEW